MRQLFLHCTMYVVAVLTHADLQLRYASIHYKKKT